MKRRIIVIALLSTFFIGYYCYSNFFSQDSLIGVYLNKNFNNKGALAEIPYESDSLRLFKNNRFTSSFWGDGTYMLTYSITGTKIAFVYNYEFGKAGYTTMVARLHGINPKMILNKENGHYLEKIILLTGFKFSVVQ